MSYSHPATRQDEWVLEHSGWPGTYIELGAYDGLKHSNTRLLQDKGWSGTLIEGHTPFYQMCCRNRPHNKIVNAFIGNGEPGTVVVGGQYTGLVSTMPADFRWGHQERNNPTYTTDTVPLATAVGINPVDYLSLDTEGNELQILHDWLKAGGKCRLLTVEFRYDMNLLRGLQWLCGDNDMELLQIRGFDACFHNVAWYV